MDEAFVSAQLDPIVGTSDDLRRDAYDFKLFVLLPSLSLALVLQR